MYLLTVTISCINLNAVSLPISSGRTDDMEQPSAA